ncbi:hypothetical protein BD309DRAFT_764299 [Dichomitus squalens]|nr:hypothetical protein BD309DRAFT_764299 [Dichomitus squalens]
MGTGIKNWERGNTIQKSLKNCDTGCSRTVACQGRRPRMFISSTHKSVSSTSPVTRLYLRVGPVASILRLVLDQPRRALLPPDGATLPGRTRIHPGTSASESPGLSVSKSVISAFRVQNQSRVRPALRRRLRERSRTPCEGHLPVASSRADSSVHLPLISGSESFITPNDGLPRPAAPSAGRGARARQTREPYV